MKMPQRTFIPGSQWLYLKLYTGVKTADRLLIKDIIPIVKELHKQKLIQKWFFIRYSDTDFHIRIRFFLERDEYLAPALAIINANIKNSVKDGLIWNVQLDTYSRELERYGAFQIDYAESIWNADSECILSIIKNLSIKKNENFRWMIALKLIDQLLSDFQFDTPRKLKLLEIISNSFKLEFGFNEYNAKQFNTKFRENKKIVESVLDGTFSQEDFIGLCSLLKHRSKINKCIYNEINKQNLNLKTKKTMDELCVSYIHMTLNRLFRSKNRKHELVLYDFMKRYYTSKIARTSK